MPLTRRTRTRAGTGASDAAQRQPRRTGRHSTAATAADPTPVALAHARARAPTRSRSRPRRGRARKVLRANRGDEDTGGDAVEDDNHNDGAPSPSPSPHGMTLQDSSDEGEDFWDVEPTSPATHSAPPRRQRAGTPSTPSTPRGRDRDGAIASASATDLTLWRYVWQALAPPLTDAAEEDMVHVHRQRVYNFAVLPYYLERFAWFGVCLCFDTFLFLFTFLPIRVLFQLPGTLWSLLSYCCCGGWGGNNSRDSVAKDGGGPSRSRSPIDGQRPHTPSGWRRRKAKSLEDVTLFSIFVVCVLALAQLDISRVYHYVRHQSVIKVYVLFNMLQIFDKMLCSFGMDIMDAAMSSLRLSRARMLLHLVVAVAYAFLHTLVLVALMVTLNVSVNSNNNSLIVVLMSNNFVELKTSVFKRFRPQNLFQVTCSDVVERFNLVVFLLMIIVQNVSHMGLTQGYTWLHRVGWICFAIYLSEIIVDWIKHGFMTKFNYMEPGVYLKFSAVLCGDVLESSSRHQRGGVGGLAAADVGTVSSSSVNLVARRLGLVPLPLACLVTRVAIQAFMQSGTRLELRVALLVVAWLVIMLTKTLLGIAVLGHASRARLEAEAAADGSGQATAGDGTGGFGPSTGATAGAGAALTPILGVLATPEPVRPVAMASDKAILLDAGDFVAVDEAALARMERYAINDAHIPVF